METIFKVGVKVYDQINFPDMEGKVVKIHKDESKYPLGVCFNGNMSIHYYDLEGRFRKENIPTLSTKPYKIVLNGFEQKEPKPTYEEILLKRGGYVSITKTLILPNKKLVNAFEALAKLIWLRDYYNEGWEPNWNTNSNKYCIVQEDLEISSKICLYASRVMCFKTKEIRDKFLEEQRELLEIAKPLL